MKQLSANFARLIIKKRPEHDSQPKSQLIPTKTKQSTSRPDGLIRFPIAPDFILADFQGRTVRLLDYRGNKHVVLVFNRGFM